MILNSRTYLKFVATALLIFLSAALQHAIAQEPEAAAVKQVQGEALQNSVAKHQEMAKRLALEESGVSVDDVEDLIGTLEDPDARGRLLSQLKTLKASVDSKPPPAVKQPSRFGGQIVEILSERIDRVSEELAIGAAVLLDAPRLVDWFHRQISVSESRQIWVEVLWKVLAVLGAGFFAGWTVRLLLARTRTAIEGRDRESIWIRLPFLFARTLVDIVPIAAFAVVAYLVLPLLHPGEITRLVAISLVNASVIARAIMASARMFFVPRATNLRVLQIGDESANYIVLWIRRLTNLTVYGYFLAEAGLLLGLSQGGYLALMKIVGLLTTLLLIIFILQNRRVVAGWVSGPESSGFPGLQLLRRRLGDVWHVLSIIYLVAVYIVWALEVSGGFDVVFRATAFSIVILLAAKMLMIGSHHAVQKGFGVRREVIAQYPGLAQRANRYFAILNVVITAAIAIVAVFAILQAWGVDSFAWVGTETGRRVIGSAISSLFVIVIAVVFWEMISSVIERYLARSDEGELELSARAKTLLPLLRRALLVVVSTVVSFIVLSEIGVNIGPLLAGAGVIGLAVGFGSQTLVKDVITGVFILAEDQFAVGDVVCVNEKSGVVEEITIRTIRFRDLGGNVHMIPFSSVGMVENMTKDFSRYVFDVGIAYREDVDEVIEVLRVLGAEMQEDDYYGPLINQPIEIMGLDKFADSAVVVRARLTTKPIKQWEVGREFNRRMKRKFDNLGIEIPFPHQTIYFGEDKSGGAPTGYIEVRDRRDKIKDPPKQSVRSVRTDSVDNVSDDGE
ncbi:MAG: mechanosensitive ion channel domain-containing protein [Pseudomonadota bacterium]|nr:mechanosensitive ion channel domain-containing protein [Pseudomonadota bacterium]